MNDASFLSALNDVQRQAATYPANGCLQILAGPGSGKTRVLTSRIAHLIINCHVPPHAICAVTFTNKAANEMKERLTKLIGKERTSQLKSGTFHSLCARFLRKYAKEADVPANFTVCDASESKKIISNLMKDYAELIRTTGLSLEPAGCASLISKAKAQGQSAREYLKQALALVGARETDEPASQDVLVGKIYVGYEAALRQNNALDFDDLLVHGVKLFTNSEECVLWCQHILVDEFQDTNVTQYELMKAIGTARCVTIVGDPDQSIYGWRSAEVKNLTRMMKDFPTTSQIFLEENYRSTSSILAASLAIVSQDTKRIKKSLFTSHPQGPLPVLYQVQDEGEEARFIAVEIKRLVASMGGSLNWGDFAILLRFNALSRSLEKALNNERIPCRILGGHKFFERLEVKDMLAYLQLIDNPAFSPAFIRVINVSARGIGDKTLNDITTRADASGKTQLEVLEGIFDGRLPDQKPTIRKKIAPFVQVIRSLRAYHAEGMAPADMLLKLAELVQYQEHLKKTQQDWESRWENVKELASFAVEIESQREAEADAQQEREGDMMDVLGDSSNISPLRYFLQASMLSSAGDNDTEEDERNKVTITTCHSAKGLEWPVVMVPSVDSMTYPFVRSEDEDEERRLLYVACTRAKAMLYVTRSLSRMMAGNTKKRTLSKFIVGAMEQGANDGASKPSFFMERIPNLEAEDRAIICKVLERTPPDEQEVTKMMDEFYKLGRDIPQTISWRPSNPVEQSPQVTGFPHFQLPAQNLQATFVRPSLNGHPPPAKGAFDFPATSTLNPRPTFASEVGHKDVPTLPVPRGQQLLTSTGFQISTRPNAVASSSRKEAPPQSKPGSTHSSAATLMTAAPNSRQTRPVVKVPTKPLQTVSNQPPPTSRPNVISSSTVSKVDSGASTPMITRPAPAGAVSHISPGTAAGAPTAVKRRLGVGRATGGYSNKKFKPPVAS